MHTRIARTKIYHDGFLFAIEILIRLSFPILACYGDNIAALLAASTKVIPGRVSLVYLHPATIPYILHIVQVGMISI